jgi:hypothetical protein
MCDRPDFEGWEEEMDEALISLFRQYQDYLKMWVDEFEELRYSDKIDCFIEDAATRLKDLQAQVEGKNEQQHGSGIEQEGQGRNEDSGTGTQ